MDRTRYPWIVLILIGLLAGCGEERNDTVDVDVEAEEGVRPGVILTDTALGSTAGPRTSEALPGPGELPPSPLPPIASNGGSRPEFSPSQPVSPVPAAPPAATAGNEGWMRGTARRGGGNVGIAILTQVRSARNDGFDRIVFDFSGATVPGYTIMYIDEPIRQCASGNVVPMPGDAWLSIQIEPAQAHDDQGRATIQQRAQSPGLPNVIALNSICDFEGQVEWVAAVRSPQEFRVSELTEPARLVVDIRH